MTGLRNVGVQLTADGAAAFNHAMAEGDAAIAKFGKSATTASGQVSSFGQITTGALRQVGAIAVNGLADAGRAMVGFLGDSIKKAGDFESGMNEFAAVTGSALGQSGKSLKDFSDLFIQLGRDLPVSTKDVEQAAIELAKGGIDPATIAAGALRTSLSLAAAGGLGLADSANIMSKQLGVWVDTAASAADKSAFLKQTADLLSQAANVTTSDVSDMALGLANVGGVAKLAGLSFRETVQSMALISPSFSSAGDAGTSFKTFLQRLQPTTKSAVAAMTDLGLYTKATGSAFYDASGQFVGMDKATALLQASTAGLTQSQKALAFQTIFGTDAIRTAAILSEKGAAGYADMGKQLDGAGTVADQAAARQQGFNTALENAKGSVEALQLTLGAALIPALANLLNTYIAPGINVITTFASSILSAANPMQALGLAIDTVVPGFTTFASGVAAVATFISTNLTPVLVGLGAVLTAVVVPAIAASVAAFASAVIAGAPVVLALAAIGVAAYGLYTAWTTNIGGIQQITASVFGTIAPLFTGLEPVFASLVGLVTNVATAFGTGGLAGAFAALQTSLPTVTAAISTWATSIGPILLGLGQQFVAWIAPMIPQMLTALGGAATALFGWISQQVGPILSKLETWGTALVSWVAPKIGALVSALGGLASAAGAWIVAQAPVLLSKLETWGTAFVTWIGPATSLLLAKAGELASAFLSWIGAQAAPILASLKAWATSFIAWIPGATVDFLSKWPGMLNQFLDWIGSAAGPLLAKLGDWAVQFVAWIVPMIPGFIVALGGIAVALGTFIAETAVVLLGKLGEWGKAFGVWIAKDAIPALVAAWPGFLASLKGLMDAADTWATAQAAAIGHGIVTGIINGLNNAAGALFSALNTMASHALATLQGAFKIHSPSQVMADEIGAPMAEGIAAGFARGMGKVTPAMVKQMEDASKAISAAASAVTAGTTALPLLAAFKAPSAASISAFTSSTTALVAALGSAAAAFKDKWLAHAGVFTDAAGKGLALISAGIDGLKKLATFKAPSIAAVNQFTDIVAVIVQSFGTVAASFKDAWLQKAQLFADTASKGLALIGSGIDGLTKLRTFKAPSVSAVNAFTDTVTLIVQSLGTVAQIFKDKWLVKASLFEETAAKGLAIIGTGVEGLTKLADFKAPSIAAINAFTDTVTLVVQSLGTVAQTFKDAWLQKANVFADAVVKGIGIIGPAIDAFTKLSTYSAIPKTALALFAADLQIVMDTMIKIAQDLGVKGPAAAAVFGDAVGRTIAPIGTAVETFTKLNDYKGVARNAVLLIGNDMAGVVATMGVIAQNMNATGVAAAAAFSTSVGVVFSGIKTAIDTLTALGKYKGVGPKHIQLLLDDITQVAGLTGAMAYQAGAAESASLEWQNHLESYATRMKAGLDAIRGLNGLTATASIHASTHIVEDGGRTAAGGANGSGTSAAGSGLFGQRVTPPASPQQIANNSVTNNAYHGPTLTYAPQYVTPARPPAQEFAIMSALVGGL